VEYLIKIIIAPYGSLQEDHIGKIIEKAEIKINPSF